MSFFNGLDLLVQAASLHGESTNQLNNYPILPKKRKYNQPINEDSSDKSDLSDGKLVIDIDESINLNNSKISSDQKLFNSTNYRPIEKDQLNNTQTANNLFKLKDNESKLIIKSERTPATKLNVKKRNSLSKDLDEEIKIIVQDIQTSRKKATRVPDELKDEEYILKRKKNNIAAKKSREQKNAKIKEMNELYDYLDDENTKLKEELFKEIMLMKLIKNKLNKSSDILRTIKQNDNLIIYKKLINFQFNLNDDENKEN